MTPSIACVCFKEQGRFKNYLVSTGNILEFKPAHANDFSFNKEYKIKWQKSDLDHDGFYTGNILFLAASEEEAMFKGKQRNVKILGKIPTALGAAASRRSVVVEHKLRVRKPEPRVAKRKVYDTTKDSASKLRQKEILRQAKQKEALEAGPSKVYDTSKDSASKLRQKEMPRQAKQKEALEAGPSKVYDTSKDSASKLRQKEMPHEAKQKEALEAGPSKRMGAPATASTSSNSDDAVDWKAKFMELQSQLCSVEESGKKTSRPRVRKLSSSDDSADDSLSLVEPMSGASSSQHLDTIAADETSSLAEPTLAAASGMQDLDTTAEMSGASTDEGELFDQEDDVATGLDFNFENPAAEDAEGNPEPQKDVGDPPSDEESIKTRVYEDLKGLKPLVETNEQVYIGSGLSVSARLWRSKIRKAKTDKKFVKSLALGTWGHDALKKRTVGGMAKRPNMIKATPTKVDLVMAAFKGRLKAGGIDEEHYPIYVAQAKKALNDKMYDEGREDDPEYRAKVKRWNDARRERRRNLNFQS